MLDIFRLYEDIPAADGCQEHNVKLDRGRRADLGRGWLGIRPNETRIPRRSRHHPLVIIPALLGPHHVDLLEDIRGRRPLSRKRQLQLTDDRIDDGVVRKKGHDLHPPPAAGTDHRIHFVDFPDHPGRGLDGSRGDCFSGSHLFVVLNQPSICSRERN
jgi:hypothetical protein